MLSPLVSALTHQLPAGLPAQLAALPVAGRAVGLSRVLHTAVLTVPVRPTVSVEPNGKLPGTEQLNSLVGGLVTWVLLACVTAILAGAAAWGLGARSGHYGASQQGRTMVLGGAVGAMITGAAAALVNFGFGLGATVH